MSVKLVATGVEFPNATIQTTAVPAPGTSGNVLTSDGTTWTSAAPSGGVTTATGVGSYIWANDTNGQTANWPNGTIAGSNIQIVGLGQGATPYGVPGTWRVQGNALLVRIV